MGNWEEGIRDIRDAEAFFRDMGCSHFHMSREYPERYEEYERLHVPKHTEQVWIRTVVEEEIEAVHRGTDVFQLADRFSHDAPPARSFREQDLARRADVLARFRTLRARLNIE